jgi:hypothetical protein
MLHASFGNQHLSWEQTLLQRTHPLQGYIGLFRGSID